MRDIPGLLLLFALVAVAYSSPLVQNGEDEPAGSGVKAKRTFCNAFTGCGRKRSEMGYGGSRDYGEEREKEEDGVLEDMARDILADARLWETLQARNALKQGKGRGRYRGERQEERRK